MSSELYAIHSAETTSLADYTKARDQFEQMKVGSFHLVAIKMIGNTRKCRMDMNAERESSEIYEVRKYE